MRGTGRPAPGPASPAASPAEERRVADGFYRRQLVLCALAAVVVLAALSVVAWVVAPEAGSHATLRPQGGRGGGIRPVSPLAESTRSATRAVVAALVAVAVVLVLLVRHMVGVARFALGGVPPPGRGPDPAPSSAPAPRSRPRPPR